MNQKQVDTVKSILGNDIFEELAKTEIVKLNSQTGVDPEEIKIALQIVPRTILSYLFSELKWRKGGDVIELDLPFAPARLHINKKGPDNYSGAIYEDNKKVCDFQHRSLPSIGLLILSSFELYDLSLLDEIKADKNEKEPPLKVKEKTDKLQDIIDERLSMSRMIKDVVDNRISEREAIDRIIKEKLSEHIESVNNKKDNKPVETLDKKSKLKAFLEARESRRQEDVELDKSEVKCPDCDTTIYKGEDTIVPCICYGQFHNKEIKIKKSKNGIKIKFPKNFDIDNVEMLLDALKNK